jgi:site-specific recombinase XerD
MGKLREQMIQDLQLKGTTPHTQHIYLREVGNLARYFGKSPDELSENEIKEYLLHLRESGLADGTFRFYAAGIKFLYSTTLQQQWVDGIKFGKRPLKLPMVLDLSEVQALFSVTHNIKHKAMLMIMYSSGLRISEVSKLKITDIDSKRMMVYVRQGKGSKDRYTILSQTTLECLRQYWHKYRPKEWLFEGQKKGTHIRYTAVRNIFCKAMKLAGITKPACPHTLRHSFATHLIESGVSLHHVQLLLGHRSPNTTTVYLHVSKLNLAQVVSPLDKISKQTV